MQILSYKIIAPLLTIATIYHIAVQVWNVKLFPKVATLGMLKLLIVLPTF